VLEAVAQVGFVEMHHGCTLRGDRGQASHVDDKAAVRLWFFVFFLY
jgi:hypothetical protein